MHVNWSNTERHDFLQATWTCKGDTFHNKRAPRHIWESAAWTRYFQIKEHRKTREALCMWQATSFFHNTLFPNLIYFHTWAASRDIQILSKKIGQQLLRGTRAHNCPKIDKRGLRGSIVCYKWKDPARL